MLSQVRLATRRLTRSPLFTTVAVLILALGIGATTVMYSLLSTILLRPLPVREPERLVMIRVGEDSMFSHPMYEDFRDRASAFAAVMASVSVPLQMTGSDRAQRVHGELVSGNYFTGLGVPTAAGRALTPDDDRIPGGHPVCVLSYRFWQRAYAGDRSAIGGDILLNGRPFRILGVAAAGFYGTELSTATDVFVPIMMTPVLHGYRLGFRGTQWLSMLARLKPGISMRQAEAATDTLHYQIVTHELAASGTAVNETTRRRILDRHIHLVSGRNGFGAMQTRYRTLLLILSCAAGLVLLIACANLANVLLVRASNRRRETAIRLALGATRAGLARETLLECGLLSLAGGGIGVWLAYTLRGILLSYLPSDSALNPELNASTLLFALAASVFCALAVGLFPIFRDRDLDLVPAIKGHTPSDFGSRLFGVQGLLVVVQVGLAVILLTGCSLFVRTLANLRAVDKGFSTDHILVAWLAPHSIGYTPERTRSFLQQLIERVQSLPGVRDAATAEVVVASGRSTGTDIRLESNGSGPGARFNLRFNYVTPGYFDLMRIPVVGGRTFQDADGPVALLNEAAARRLFPNSSPIGRHFAWNTVKPETEIVGVVRDAKYAGIRQETPPLIYVPMRQSSPFEPAIHIRTAGDPMKVVPLLRREVAALDPGMAVYGIKTLSEQVDESITTERMSASVSSLLGVIALSLAAIGLYGVIAFTVARRTREIGIRIALGARPENVIAGVIRSTALLVGVGTVFGLAVSAACSHLVESLLYGVRSNNPAGYVAVTAAVIAISGISSVAPALRAARVDPVVALRQD